MTRTERPQDSLIWLLAAPVLANLLFPGEIHIWPQWLVAAVTLVLASLFAAVWVLRQNTDRFGIAAPPASFIILLVAAGISGLFARIHFARSRDMFLMLLVYALLYIAFRDSPLQSLRPILWGVFSVSVCIAAYGLYQYFYLWTSLESAAKALGSVSSSVGDAVRFRLETKRIMSVFALPTTLCDFLAMTFPINIALLISSARKPIRLLVISCLLAINMWALLLTRSFTGFLSLVFCAGAFYFAGRSGFRVLKKKWLTASILLAFFAAAFFYLLYVRKIIFVEVIRENPLALRMINWRIGIEAGLDHPIIGVGPDNYQTVYTQYMRAGEPQARHAHSAPIEIFAETGIVGGVAFLLLLFRWLARAWRILRRSDEESWENKGLALSFLALFFQNLLDIGIYLPSLGCLSFMLIGLLDRPLVSVDDLAASRNPKPPLTPLWRWSLATILLGLGVGSALLCRRLLLAKIDYRESLDLYSEGRIEEAEQNAVSSIRRDPLSYPAYEILASQWLSSPKNNAKAIGDARSLYLRALMLSPYTASLHRGMSYACVARGELFQAYRHALRAAELYPADQSAAARRDELFAALTASAGKSQL